MPSIKCGDPLGAKPFMIIYAPILNNITNKNITNIKNTIFANILFEDNIPFAQFVLFALFVEKD
jgi:hypothetical protein